MPKKASGRPARPDGTRCTRRARPRHRASGRHAACSARAGSPPAHTKPLSPRLCRCARSRWALAQLTPAGPGPKAGARRPPDPLPPAAAAGGSARPAFAPAGLPPPAPPATRVAAPPAAIAAGSALAPGSAAQAGSVALSGPRAAGVARGPRAAGKVVALGYVACSSGVGLRPSGRPRNGAGSREEGLACGQAAVPGAGPDAARERIAPLRGEPAAARGRAAPDEAAYGGAYIVPKRSQGR